MLHPSKPVRSTSKNMHEQVMYIELILKASYGDVHCPMGVRQGQVPLCGMHGF